MTLQQRPFVNKNGVQLNSMVFHVFAVWQPRGYKQAIACALCKLWVNNPAFLFLHARKNMWHKTIQQLLKKLHYGERNLKNEQKPAHTASLAIYAVLNKCLCFLISYEPKDAPLFVV